MGFNEAKFRNQNQAYSDTTAPTLQRLLDWAVADLVYDWYYNFFAYVEHRQTRWRFSVLNPYDRTIYTQPIGFKHWTKDWFFRTATIAEVKLIIFDSQMSRTVASKSFRWKVLLEWQNRPDEYYFKNSRFAGERCPTSCFQSSNRKKLKWCFQDAPRVFNCLKFWRRIFPWKIKKKSHKNVCPLSCHWPFATHLPLNACVVTCRVARVMETFMQSYKSRLSQ